MEPLTIKLRTLTPLWTGGVDGQCDRLHETGLIGSLRWWYEALVRGLGGRACDPTSEDRCPDKAEKRCVACELFGCTGWARKFQLRVLDEQNNLINQNLGQDLVFNLQFLERREMRPEERWLLIKAIEVAAKYGALGGKTTLKPQKKGSIGKDYGIVQINTLPNLAPVDVRAYLQARNWRSVSTQSPDIRWFFFVQGIFLWRKQINRLIGLSEDGKQVIGHEAYQKFLRGRRGSGNSPAISKKLFSFQADGGRVWGYAQDAPMRDHIVRELKKVLGDRAYTVKTGEEVLNEL